ncbi:MAG: hypothetical protein ACTHN3_03730 [Solirubrobacterales bacterium]
MAARLHREFALSIDLETRKATELVEVELSEIGIKERQDLQRWVEDHPEMIGGDLLLITTEFNRWELKQEKVADRLDVLFLDSDGHPLVAELKRGEAGDTTELQALKYAAYCSSLTSDELAEEFAAYHGTTVEEAHEVIVEHAPSLDDGEPGAVRVQLLAGRFGPAVTTVVLWLNDLGLDIGCVEIRVRKLSDDKAVLVSRQILPPPDAADFLVRRRKREEAEEKKEAREKKRNAVTVITEKGALDIGTELSLIPQSFSEKQRPVIEAKIEENPDYGKVLWTGKGSRHAIKWKLDGNTYSVSGLVAHMLDEQELYRGGIRGPLFWSAPDGRTLNEVAEQLSAPDMEIALDSDVIGAAGSSEAVSTVSGLAPADLQALSESMRLES